MSLTDTYKGAEADYIRNAQIQTPGAEGGDVARVDIERSLLSLAPGAWLGDVSRSFDIQLWGFAGAAKKLPLEGASTAFRVDEEGQETAIGNVLEFINSGGDEGAPADSARHRPDHRRRLERRPRPGRSGPRARPAQHPGLSHRPRQPGAAARRLGPRAARPAGIPARRHALPPGHRHGHQRRAHARDPRAARRRPRRGRAAGGDAARRPAAASRDDLRAAHRRPPHLHRPHPPDRGPARPRQEPRRDGRRDRGPQDPRAAD